MGTSPKVMTTGEPVASGHLLTPVEQVGAEDNTAGKGLKAQRVVGRRAQVRKDTPEISRADSAPEAISLPALSRPCSSLCHRPEYFVVSSDQLGNMHWLKRHFLYTHYMSVSLG